MNDKKIEIVYADKFLTVCIKPAGMSCEASDDRECLPSLIAEALSTEYVGTVHRLDTVTQGLMLYSLNAKVTGRLSEAMATHDTEKEYLAVVHGRPTTPEGEMRDLLFRDSAKNKSFVVKRPRKGVREAILSYRLLDSKDTEAGTLSLIRIRLITGRTHQIRVQFASRAMPLLGDGKYGSRDNAPRVALFSTRLSFTHPANGKQMTFERSPEGDPWDLFQIKQNSENNQE